MVLGPWSSVLGPWSCSTSDPNTLRRPPGLSIEHALPDLEISLTEHFLSPTEASRLFDALLPGLNWRSDAIRLFGKTVPIPRRHQWYGDPEASYSWSGLTMNPLPWTPDLSSIRDRLHEHTGHRFNGMLANLYRSGADTMGWHADDEPELGHNPVVASVSLGATRDFALRHKTLPEHRLVLPLAAGSLLLMTGPTQHHYKHALPRRKRVEGARINLTFRSLSRTTSR